MEEGTIEEEAVLDNIIIESNEFEEFCVMNQSEECGIGEVSRRPIKRPRAVDEEERWITVGKSGKRISQKVDIHVSSAQMMPKQFALAKILKTQGIENISRVKYISPYKVLIQFENSTSAEKLINCEAIQDLEWRCAKPLEVAVSYGVIKDIELDLSEKDMLEMISSQNKVMAVKRLKRRNSEGNNWEESESVRIAFKGSILPTAVYIYGMRINVDPYVFPVTQCSKCWRFGHALRMCPTKKVVCPKCGEGHANCETNTYKCVNCLGNHYALDRACPKYRKEKRIRELMAELNCSYRKAIQMYTPPEPSTLNIEVTPATFPPLPRDRPPAVPESQDSQSVKPTYGSVTRLRTSIQNHDNPVMYESGEPSAMDVSQPVQEKARRKNKKKQQSSLGEVFNLVYSSESDTASNENLDEDLPERKQRRQDFKLKMNFKQLLSKLYKIIMNSQTEMKSKIVQVVSISVEWLLSVAGQFILDLPFKRMFGSQ